jgi:uncharacterized damage-inducible protein DinB
MLCYTGEDLARSFRGVRGHTIQIATEIPEIQYGAVGAPGTRTVAQLLTHMALGPRFQRAIHGQSRDTLAGFDFPGLMRELAAEESKGRTKAEIIALLQKEGEDYAIWVASLSDDFLAERVQMPAGQQPATKSRLELLMSPKEHEMHHRAQLMVIERQLGIIPHLTRARQEQMAAART